MARLRIVCIALCVAALLEATALATAADLSKIDRTIRKEPVYSNQPRYALLVFGPSARTRVWVILDGNTLYVDRNGDGDLTGKDEVFILASLEKCEIEVRDPDGRTRYVITGISTFADPKNSDERHLMVNVKIEGPVSYRQYCGAKPSASPDGAAIAHFHGPLTIGPRTFNWKPTPDLARLPVGDPPGEVYAMVGTMDAEHGCWVVVRSDDLPKDLHPVVDVEYMGQNPDSPSIRKRYRLEQRC